MRKNIISIIIALFITAVAVSLIIFTFRTGNEDLNLDVETLTESWINPYASLYYKYCIPFNPYASDINFINNPYGSYYFKYPTIGNPYGSIFNKYRNDLWAYGSLYSKYDQYKDNGYAYYINNPYASVYSKYAPYDYGLNDSYASLFANYCYINNPYGSLYWEYINPPMPVPTVEDIDADIKILNNINLDAAPDRKTFKLSNWVEIGFDLYGIQPEANIKFKVVNKTLGKLRYIAPSPTPVQSPAMSTQKFIFPDEKIARSPAGTDYVEVQGDLASLQNFLTNLYFIPVKHATNRIIVQIDADRDGKPEASGYLDVKASPTISMQTLVDFESVTIKNPVIKQVELFNTKAKEITKITNISLNQNQNFRLIDNTDSCKVGVSLAPSKTSSCKIYIEFNPQIKATALSSYVKVIFDNEADIKIELTGVALSQRGSGSQKRSYRGGSSLTTSKPKVTVTPKASTCNKPFSDVECDNKLISYILDLKSQNIIKGNAEGNFLPATFVTRAEVATFIVNGFRLTGNNIVDNKFWDVNPSRTHHHNILLLAQLNIVNGYSDGSFRPDQIVKREEISKFIVNALKIKGIIVSENRLNNFVDVSTDNKFKNYIAYLSTEKVGSEFMMSGSVRSGNQKMFNPSDNLTREQMAKIISNAVKKTK